VGLQAEVQDSKEAQPVPTRQIAVGARAAERLTTKVSLPVRAAQPAHKAKLVDRLVHKVDRLAVKDRRAVRRVQTVEWAAQVAVSPEAPEVNLVLAAPTQVPAVRWVAKRVDRWAAAAADPAAIPAQAARKAEVRMDRRGSTAAAVR
jgi:hypothetical protein